jgi:tetrachlorobenzoquinone reductase
MTGPNPSASAARETVTMTGQRHLRVASAASVARDVRALRLVDPTGAPLPAWTPGSHIDLVLPSLRVRQYSLCGSVEDRTGFTVAVLRVAGGRGGSAEIHDSDLVGSDLLVRGPRNMFPVVEAPFHLLLAGGIGITPLITMARFLAHGQQPWSLIYGARSLDRMLFREELGELGRAADVRCVAQDVAGLPDLAGAVARAPDGAAIYCCGPEPMLNLVAEVCVQQAGRVILYTERFGPDSPVVTGEVEDRPFELELARTGVRITVPAGTTALEAVLEVVPDHPYACQGGQCGTCEVAVLRGEVDHRDEIQSDAERLANRSMFLCVSRARSASVVIDL